MWEDEWIHNVNIANDHLKYHDVDRVFGFRLQKHESVLRLTPKHTEIFVRQAVKCHFRISGRMNSVMVLLSSQTVPNWLSFAAQIIQINILPGKQSSLKCECFFYYRYDFFGALNVVIFFSVFYALNTMMIFLKKWWLQQESKICAIDKKISLKVKNLFCIFVSRRWTQRQKLYS